MIVPLAVGLGVGTDAREPSSDFYATGAQVIATLFLAVTVDFFARQATGEGIQDAVVALVLSGQSWIGFFACIRALTGAPGPVTLGLTAMGVTAASVLLALRFYDAMRARENVSEREKAVAAIVILIVLVSALALLAV